jgi:hypothetical protein
MAFRYQDFSLQSDTAQSTRLKLAPFKGPIDSFVALHAAKWAAGQKLAPEHFGKVEAAFRSKAAQRNSMLPAEEVMMTVSVLFGLTIWCVTTRYTQPVRNFLKAWNHLVVAPLETVDDVALNDWGPWLADPRTTAPHYAIPLGAPGGGRLQRRVAQLVDQ